MKLKIMNSYLSKRNWNMTEKNIWFLKISQSLARDLETKKMSSTSWRNCIRKDKFRKKERIQKRSLEEVTLARLSLNNYLTSSQNRKLRVPKYQNQSSRNTAIFRSSKICMLFPNQSWSKNHKSQLIQMKAIRLVLPFSLEWLFWKSSVIWPTKRSLQS